MSVRAVIIVSAQERLPGSGSGEHRPPPPHLLRPGTKPEQGARKIHSELQGLP